MNMKTTPFLAMHGHFGGGAGVLLIMAFLLVVLMAIVWQGKSETK
jgi:hypothetical protein